MSCPDSSPNTFDDVGVIDRSSDTLSRTLIFPSRLSGTNGGLVNMLTRAQKAAQQAALLLGVPDVSAALQPPPSAPVPPRVGVSSAHKADDFSGCKGMRGVRFATKANGTRLSFPRKPVHVFVLERKGILPNH